MQTSIATVSIAGDLPRKLAGQIPPNCAVAAKQPDAGTWALVQVCGRCVGHSMRPGFRSAGYAFVAK